MKELGGERLKMQNRGRKILEQIRKEMESSKMKYFEINNPLIDLGKGWSRGILDGIGGRSLDTMLKKYEKINRAQTTCFRLINLSF